MYMRFVSLAMHKCTLDINVPFKCIIDYYAHIMIFSTRNILNTLCYQFENG